MARRLLLSLSVLSTVAALVFLYRSAAGIFEQPSRASRSDLDPAVVLGSRTPVTPSVSSVPPGTSGSSSVPAPSTTPSGPASASGSLLPAGSSGGADSPVSDDDAAIGVDVLRRVNAERAGTGAGSLRSDPVLTEFASAWAEEMASSGYRHSDPDRLRRILAAAGVASVSENIHAPEPQCPLSGVCADPAYQPTSGVLHVDWMHSASHRTTAMHPAWSRAGVGVHCDASGRLWAVVLFGSEPGTTRDPGFEAPSNDLREPGNDGFLCAGGSRGTNPSWRHTPVS